MLDDLPPTPDPHPQSHPPQAPDIQQMPRRSPRKPKVTKYHSSSKQSPRKLRSRKHQPSTSLSSAGRKEKRGSHRPSATPVESTTSSASETETIAAVDEVPRTQYHPSIFPPPPPLAVPSFSLKPSTSTTSILHSPFVLPPPSPEASLPRQPLFPPSSSLQFQSMRQPDFLMTHLPLPHLSMSPPLFQVRNLFLTLIPRLRLKFKKELLHRSNDSFLIKPNHFLNGLFTLIRL